MKAVAEGFAVGLMMPRTWAAALALSLFHLALAPQQTLARPQPLPAKAPVLARSCVVKLPEADPIFPAPPGGISVKTDDKSEDDDDDDDADDEDDDDTPGLMLPGSTTCVAISGTVSAGIQFDSYRLPRALGSPPPPAITWQPYASMRIATSHDLASGLRIGTAFEMSLTPKAGQPDSAVIEEATVLVGPMTFGLASSRFSFWTADEFIFSARLPNRNVGIIGWERDLTERWNLSLSIEDPTLATTSTIPVVRGLVPDGVARLLYTAGPLTVHLAGALRDVPGPPSRLGRAGIVGATYETKLFDRPGNITAQIASGVDAAPYLGSQLDASVLSQILLPEDATRGFSGVIAARREWTDQLASNIYVSRYQLTVPLSDASKGKVRIDRLAVNLVWTPVTGFKTGIETSVAETHIALADRILPASLTGRLFSTQVFVERVF